jgi:hypothetical protein
VGSTQIWRERSLPTVIPKKMAAGAIPVVCMTMAVVRGEVLVVVPWETMMKRRLVEGDERKSGRIVTVLRQTMDLQCWLTA